MNKYETPDMTLPLFLTVIPSFLLGLLFVSELWGIFTIVLSGVAYISLTQIREDRIDYKKAYLKSLVSGLIMFLAAPFFAGAAVLYIFCSFAAVFAVVYISMMNNDDVTIGNILAITFMNPLIPLLPVMGAFGFIMYIIYGGIGLAPF